MSIMNMKLVNALVKIGMQIEREMTKETFNANKVRGLRADSERLWKLATSQERSEYQRRMA